MGYEGKAESRKEKRRKGQKATVGTRRVMYEWKGQGKKGAQDGMQGTEEKKCPM